ncbi:LytS/YhcK type 5TM receptor domain-containing protein [Pseudovibrio sp. Ad37]|uniref:LytS/YhcK type 5TM receptor domain-containing protein n=1 Tax=Pseudovibrio sp. Ad37 TaxID=989422 RepID=UPI00315D8E88
MSGLLSGPVTGFLIGLTGGLHRYGFGGFTDLACAISTTSEGLLAGMAAFCLRTHNKRALLFRRCLCLASPLWRKSYRCSSS